VGPTRCAI